MMRRIFILFFLACISCGVVSGQSKQIRELQNKRKTAMKNIAETQKLLKTTQKTTKSSLNQLRLLNSQISAQHEVINLLNKELSELNRQQRAISDTVYLLEKDLKIKKDSYAKAMRGIYNHRSGYDIMMFIFSSESLQQSYRRIRYLKEYSAWRKEEAEAIKAMQVQLNARKEELAKTMQAKKKLLSQRTQVANDLKTKEGKQQEVVAGLKKKEKDLKKELEKQNKQAIALDKRIEALIEEEARKAAEEARKAEEAARKRAQGGTKKGADDNKNQPEERHAQTQGGYAMTKAERELSGSFEKNKGRLPFPLSGKYLIVGHFGQQKHQELKYVQIKNSGIDIQTTPGTVARSVFAGVVTKVFVMPGYNSSVIVRHGNYLTIYSNLSEVYVKTGEKISARQSIGKIYSDPEDGNRTVLHFQLWKETTKLNPETWLDK
ncbi:murein hydrolase activator EnvC family protein [Coprobacter tertius]